METNELIKAYAERQEAYNKEAERLRKRVDNAHLRLEKHERKRPFWTQELVKPICEAIAKETGLHIDENERYLTFGCRAECPIFFHNDNGDCVGGITFTFRTLNGVYVLLYDTGKKIADVSPTSLAGLNGFDNETAPLPATLQEIINKCLYKKGK